MKISKERLEREAKNTGFRPEVLEKVIHLMELLNAFMDEAFLSKRIALKGGTALNLFCYECPRLSVDIDINYIGAIDKETMLKERKNQLISIIEDICVNKDYITQTKPSEHAGGKWRIRYQSDLPGDPRLEVDLNFLARVPLWEVGTQSSIRLGSYQVKKFPLLDKHELAAGKLTALFSRHASRDLFDAYHLLSDQNFNLDKLRIAFIVYGGMSRVDWRNIKIENIHYEGVELKNMLLPVLRKKEIDSLENGRKWGSQLVKSCQEKLSQLLPFRKNELEFLTHLSDFGEIKPELLTDDKELIFKIQHQPGLLWKALNVKRHKGITI